MLKTIKGHQKLTDKQKRLFEATYKRHFLSMGESERQKHFIHQIKEVKYNEQENCIEVHFEHEWYKYYPNKTWG